MKQLCRQHFQILDNLVRKKSKEVHQNEVDSAPIRIPMNLWANESLKINICFLTEKKSFAFQKRLTPIFGRTVLKCHNPVIVTLASTTTKN